MKTVEKQLKEIYDSKINLSDLLYTTPLPKVSKDVSDLMKECFNLGVQMAATNAEVEYDYNFQGAHWQVDKESILKLLIK